MQKNKFLMIITFLFLSTVTYFSCIYAAVNKPENQAVILVGSDNPSFKIHLQTIPSSGYQWLLHNYDKSLITPIKASFLNDPSAATSKANLGASMTQEWEFKANPQALAVPTITEVTFFNLRPWDVDENLSFKDEASFKIIFDPNYKPKPQTTTP